MSFIRYVKGQEATKFLVEVTDDHRCIHQINSSLFWQMASVGMAPTSGLRESGSHAVGVDSLPEEMNDMKIRDDKEMEATVVDGNGTETGHIIVTTIGGRNGQPKQTISYMAERVVGHGSFGVVFQAKCLENGETVAIKKVLQDKRYKNRELQTMRLLDHPNVVSLKHCFFSTTEKDELYLNLVLEYVPETIHRVIKHYNKLNQRIPLIYVKLYTYQIFRALSYIHCGIGVCHRDIKPQNLLVKGEPNISYICSRYYRAPELIFGATEYTTNIDIWSAGCVLAELLLGQPLFPGESGVDQLVEIIKIFHKRMPPEAVDLVSRLLQYSPNLRCTAREEKMPLGKYYCDYCDKQFQDTPASRRRHLQGVAHQRAKALWYDTFRTSSQCLFLISRSKNIHSDTLTNTS
ncbi:hypothetical protein DH2020_003156 [Rehmannia glutinosa]|uniref:non-specific serine/threonine protein kinase n=1 Tax=Rehmannia glutinosa TaxID=99300 RepID=A0ABR0XKT4_REHGL